MLQSAILQRTFRAFHHRNFRLMWFGACTSTVGTFVQQFAQSWLVYDLTKNPFYLGLDLFLGQLGFNVQISERDGAAVERQPLRNIPEGVARDR